MTQAARMFLAAFLLVPAIFAQQRTLKPGMNFFSKEQDIQLGKEAAAQVEREMDVVRDPALNEYINRLGRRLVEQPEADRYPYTFKIVNNPAINAFALPGGPTYIHTGLIAAADNEEQLVGVMAHEVSHVALRHGTNQVSKANLIQIPALLAGAMAGGSMLGQLAQIGIGLGANSLLLKYSRNAERDADLLGTRMMAKAGYNPIEMARFFEKLEAQGGNRGPEFLASHPNPGNRMKAVQDEIRYLPQRQYNAASGQFDQMKRRAADLLKSYSPAKTPQPQQLTPQSLRPSGRFRQHRGQKLSIAYPDNWETFSQSNNPSALTIAPRAGVLSNGVGYGVIVSVYNSQAGAADLRRDTRQLIREMQAANASMRAAGASRRLRVDNHDALVTTLYSQSPFAGGQREIDMLVTVARPEGLLYLVFIAPESEFRQVQATFEEMLRSVRFSS